jgi:protocatechuate 3,4-dioxygenase beta subunit
VRRSAVLLLLLFCVAALVILLLQKGGGDDRAAARRRERGRAAVPGALATDAEAGSVGATDAGKAAGSAAPDDDPNRVPGLDLVLAGRVVKDGKGVEGATVVALRAAPANDLPSRWSMQSFLSPPPPIATTVSEAGGRFELRIARRSRVVVRAAKKGSGSASLFLLVPKEGNPPDVTLRLRPGGRVEGIVVDENEKPVKDADVVLATQEWLRGSVETATKTDEEGRFALDDVPDGSSRVRASAEGYPETQTWVYLPGQKFVRIELQPGGTVAGNVVDGNGSPVAGAHIFLSTSAWERGRSSGVAKGETYGKGAYRLTVYPGGVQSVIVEHPSYGRQAAGPDTFDLPVALVESGKELKYDIKLRKGVSVKGVVVYESGTPAKDATVTLLRMSTQWRGMSDVDATSTDENGRFEFPYVIEGTYGLEAKTDAAARLAVRYAQQNQRPTIDFFTDGETSVPEQRIELVPTGAVHGKILGIGDPDPNQRPGVFLQNGTSYLSATVDDVGTFELTNVPPMEDAVVQSNNPQAKSDPFRIEAGKVAEVTLDASKQGITGVVEDERGTPVARARVYVFPESQLQQQLPQVVQQRGWGGALTDEQGRFTANLANYAGDYWRSQKFVAVAYQQGYALATSESFDMPAEGAQGPELRLVLAPGGIVRGRVEFASGAPAPGITVSLSPKPDPNEKGKIDARGPQTAYTGYDGSFEISGLADGVYVLSAYHAEGKVESVEVRAGAEGVKLVIEPALAIAGVVVTESGSPVASAQVTVLVPQERGEQRMSGTTQSNGRFRIGQLAAGSYPVEVSPNSQQYYGGVRLSFEKQRVEGVAAGTEDLKIVVSEGKGLRGKVEDPTGQPVPGAGVIAMPLEAPKPQRQQGQPYQWQQANPPSAMTNGRGEFEIKGVGDGEVEVLALAQGFLPGSQRAVAGGAPITLRLGQGETLEGRVLTADGTAAARRWIWLQPMTKETQEKMTDWQQRGGQAWSYLGGWSMQSTSTDGDGRFKFASLLPGDYRLQGQQMGDEILPQTTVHTGSGLATLRYEKALSIKGRVTDAAGRPISLPAGQMLYVNVRQGQQWYSGAAVGSDGNFEIKGVPSGAVTLQVWGGSEYKPATVETVGGATGLLITLEKNTPQPPPKPAGK